MSGAGKKSRDSYKGIEALFATDGGLLVMPRHHPRAVGQRKEATPDTVYQRIVVPPLKSVRPMEPAKSVSPTNT